MTRAAVASLRASDDAAIVNTASIAGKRGSARLAAYCGSKWAVIGITQSFAHELAPDGIRVNALCPGMVGTAMWTRPPDGQPGQSRVSETNIGHHAPRATANRGGHGPGGRLPRFRAQRHWHRAKRSWRLRDALIDPSRGCETGVDSLRGFQRFPTGSWANVAFRPPSARA